MMYIHQDSGLINISYFKFDVDDTNGQLESNRAVPFRLTPNIAEYLSSIGTTGPLTASAIATARCLVQPNFKVISGALEKSQRTYANRALFFFAFLQLPTILRAILSDEIIAIHKKRLKDEKPQLDANGDIVPEGPSTEVNMENIITLVNKSVSSIMGRLNNISYFDNVESNKMGTLVQAAHNPDNLCRMDPAWHPWV